MGLMRVNYEKRSMIKEQMKRVLNSALPTTFKLSAMHELIKVSQLVSIQGFTLYSIRQVFDNIT